MTRLLILAFVVPIIGALMSCNSPTEPLPDELLRIWRNPAPGYRHNYFEVRKDFVIFGTGQYSLKMHSISRVQSETSGDTTTLTIDYRTDDGETNSVDLEHTPGDPPSLRIGARQDVWVPEKYADWLKLEES